MYEEEDQGKKSVIPVFSAHTARHIKW